ncbi:uncharacterized protein BJX67DRAFT_381255 [Aspergillus lucknowensis]|uniref:Uncharacterized protein n=1 Tax=Aspergillus lucknowensis TaxID=176173 RepID=A0ABR4LSX7_9EURO
MGSISVIYGLLFLLVSLVQSTTLDPTLASLGSLRQSLESVQRASRNYDGGITSTTNLLFAAYQLDRKVQNIANAFDGLGQLDPDGVERWEEVYRQLLPTASEAANSFADMVCALEL